MTVVVDESVVRGLRASRRWAVALAWVALLVGVPLVAYYAVVGMASGWYSWIRVSLVVVTALLAVAQVVAVLLRRWTTAAVLLAVVAAPWVVAALVGATPWLLGMGFVVLPGALPWLPALIACVVVRAREERAAGGPRVADHERRVRAWAWALVASASILTATTAAVVVAMGGAWWFWGVIVVVLLALVGVSLGVLALVERRDWPAADGRATMLLAMWVLAGAVGWLVLLTPAVLLAIPCRRVALHARALAWYAAQPAPVDQEPAISP